MRKSQRVALIFTASSFLQPALSQTLTDVTQCWQSCISGAGQIECAALDVPCICRVWGGQYYLTSVLSCIRSNCDNGIDTNLLLSPLELTCELAGAPIPSSIVSSALEAATSTTEATTYITATVTESYWQSTFGTSATTIVMPATDSNGHTVIVAYPVTIEPSTTIFGSPSTSTPESQSSPSAGSNYNFGNCNNPEIVYGYGFDGRNQYSFEPANQTQFPHGSSLDIATIESFICNHLQDTCHASTDAQQACSDAFNAYSGLAGQNAANVWNIALGFSANPPIYATETSTATSTLLSPEQSSAAISASSVLQSIFSSEESSALSAITTTTTTRADGIGDPSTTTTTATATTTEETTSETSGSNSNGSPFDSQNIAISSRPQNIFLTIFVLLLSLYLI